MPAQKLISQINKIFRSARNTFKAADFVYTSEQEILPKKYFIKSFFDEYPQPLP